jgi:WS/DGAT/MGAT family acyltransferase
LAELRNGHQGRDARPEDDLARYRAIRDAELPLHVGALCIVDGPLDVRAIENRLVERVGWVPRLTRSLEDDRTGWMGRPVQDFGRFEPAAQVQRASALPPGGDAELAAAAAEAWSRRLRRDRPPWEITVIDGLARGRTALVVKAHRGLVDDGGGIELAELLLGNAAACLPPVPPARPRPAVPARREPSATALVAGMLAQASRPLIERTRAVGRGVAGMLEPGAAMRQARDLGRWLESTSLIVSTPAPETPFNGSLGAARRLGFVRLARDVLAGIEETLEASREAVVLAILGDALGRYLKGRGRVTTALELVALSDPVGAAGSLVSIPVGALDARARVDAIRGSLRDPASRARRRSLDDVVSLCLTLPAGARSVAASLAYQAVNTTCVQARPPRAAGELAGRRVLLASAVAPLPWNVGLGFCWVDPGGDEVVVGVHADTQLVPDVEQVEECVRAAYVEAAASSGVPAIDPERCMPAPA